MQDNKMAKQTLTQKVLAKHCGKKTVMPGEFIEAKVDIALSNDITSPLAIEQFKKFGLERVFNKNRVVIVLDHFTPNKDISSAQQCKFIREFATEQKLKYFFDGGRVGIEHALLPEQKIVLPGQVVIGADSHTCTYGALGAFATGVGSTDISVVWATGKIWLKVPAAVKFVYSGRRNKWVYGKDLILWTIGKIGVDGANYKTMEFTGPVIESMPMPERFTMCNMSIEGGAKNGIMENRAKGLTSDRDAEYEGVMEIDVGKIEPQVAFPHLPSKSRPVSEADGISIDQAVIGSCTNGWLSDLRIAAKILKGKKAHPRVRLLVFPATPQIYLRAVKEGLVDVFVRAGGIVNPPTCGPCLGGHLGILAKGERCIATTNRNFVGRMGHTESEVYLSNPAVAAASAIAGKIVHPEKVV